MRTERRGDSIGVKGSLGRRWSTKGKLGDNLIANLISNYTPKPSWNPNIVTAKAGIRALRAGNLQGMLADARNLYRNQQGTAAGGVVGFRVYGCP